MANASSSRIKIAVLWTRMSGYLNACLKELAHREGVEIMISYALPSPEAPFDSSRFEWVQTRFPWTGRPDVKQLTAALQKFEPDVLVFTGWHQPAYRAIARQWKGKCLRVMTIDNCWLGTMKQRSAARFIAPMIRALADYVWLPGERQAVFARRFGFSEQAILRGVYACDKQPFDRVYHERIAEGRSLPKAFIFVGRFVEQKGIDTLIRAYKAYRENVEVPWPLICCGAGPFQNQLESVDGIKLLGFRQPDKLPSDFSNCGCLVLPSKFEPWAVVVHEAVSAGLIVLASQQVGAAVHLVQPGFNGFIFDSESPAQLAELFGRVSAFSNERLERMSRASVALAEQFSLSLWADTLMDKGNTWKNGTAGMAS
jgi:glycosyltransferase involved in cell wall biosynthesis